MALKGTIYSYLSFTEQLTPSGTLDQINRSIPTAGGPLGISAGYGIQDFGLGASMGAKTLWTYGNAAFTGASTFDLTALPAPEAVAIATGSPVITAAVVKGIWIYSGAPDGQILYFGNPGTNGWTAWTDTAAARALVMGGMPWAIGNLLAQATAPWTVDATHKVIKLDAGGNTFPVYMAILVA
jgi:hypothetical protein